jgi:hypothetical protein
MMGAMGEDAFDGALPDPVPFDGFSIQKDLPIGDNREYPNCDAWAVVDFGHGPVEVRCTGIGEHEEHLCQVFFVEEDNAEDDANPTMN